MNLKNKHARYPRGSHRLTRIRSLENVSGTPGAAFLASTTHLLCMLEDAAAGPNSFELNATKMVDSADPFQFKVLSIEDGTLLIQHAATNGKRWWRFFYGVKVVAGEVPLETIQESLIQRAREVTKGPRTIGAFGLAMKAAAGAPDPIADLHALFEEDLPPPAKKPAAPKPKAPPKKPAAPKAKLPPPAPPKSGAPPAKAPPKAKASGPLPVDIDDSACWQLLLEACRNGFEKGVWLSEANSDRAIALAIVNCEPSYEESQVPEDWVSKVRNRMMMRDLLRDQAGSGGVTFYQLVLPGERETPFSEPEGETLGVSPDSADEDPPAETPEPDVSEDDPPESPPKDEQAAEAPADPGEIHPGPEASPPGQALGDVDLPGMSISEMLAEQARLHREIAERHELLARISERLIGSVSEG